MLIHDRNPRGKARPKLFIPEVMPEPTKHREYLSEEVRRRIVQLIAVYKSNLEIIRDIREEFGEDIAKPITKFTLAHYRNDDKWKPLLAKYREEYERAVDGIPIASRKLRLERLETNYQDVMEDVTLTKKEKINLALSHIHEAGGIMEPKTYNDGRPNLYMMTQVNNYKELSDEEIKEKQLKLLEEMAKVKKLKEIEDARETGKRIKS